MMTHSADDRRSQSSWRSTGWASLKYPLPAIISAAVGVETTGGKVASSNQGGRTLNRTFPLHKDVILACARELLILDGSVDKKTLKVVHQSISTKEGSPDDASAVPASLGSNNKSNFLRHMMQQASHGHDPKSVCSTAAEDVANEILKRTVQKDGFYTNEPAAAPDNAKPPRKVSDATATDTVGASLSASAGNNPSLPPGMFALVASGHHVSPSDLSIAQLPNLVDVSISTENHLRATARTMVASMTSTFEERPLREFLGYRSNAKSAPKRFQLVEGIASFLFDVSHATFAFDAELDGMDRAAARSGSLDQKVCSLLFDARSLKGIGGFDNSSLLRHALSIGRARATNQSWEAFAASAHGRNMLRHHWSGNTAALVGQKRRRNRPRSRSSGMLDNKQGGGKRSSSSSVASFSSTSTLDEIEHLVPPVAGTSSITTPIGVASGRIATFGAISDVVSLTIERDIGNSWGVSLANEGGMCVVQRVAREEVPGGLKLGDMIVSAKTSDGSSVSLASRSNQDQNVESIVPAQSFYRRIVNVFKESGTSTLFLEVRRVGGAIVALG